MTDHRLKPEFEVGDWYQDDNGLLWEYGFDIKNVVHRWFEIDYWLCGLPEGRQIEPLKETPKP